MEYATNGKGNAALTLGIIGTGLSALSGGLNGILGGSNNAGDYVSRETFDLSMQLAKSERENAILSADLSSEKKMVEIFNSLNDKINKVTSEQTAINSAQGVTNSLVSSQLAVQQNNISLLMGLTKLGIPNSSLCPGYGTATVSVTSTSTT